MKKRKIALALSLCLAIGATAGALVACGGDKKSDPPPKAGDASAYYLAGESAGALFAESGDWSGTTFKKPADVVDGIGFKYTETDNVYELTAEMYNGDKFKVLQTGKNWDWYVGGESLDPESGEETDFQAIADGVSAQKNIICKKDGKWKFTLTIGSDGAGTLAYEKVGEATKLPNPATAVTINKTAATIKVGEEVQLSIATITPTDADEETASWASADTAKVTVDSTGKIKGIASTKSGETFATVDVTVTYGTVTATCKVKVLGEGEEIAATAVTVTNKDALKHVHVGQDVEVLTSLTPEDSTDSVALTLATDDTAATVNDGKVTGVEVGTATLTATARTGVTATADVKVVKDWYFLGSSINKDFPGWNTIDKYGDIKEGVRLDYDDSTAGTVKWSATVDLYKGDLFRFGELNKKWDSSVGASQLAEASGNVNKATQIVAAGGDDNNITVKEHGKYKVTIVDNGTKTEISFEKVGDAAAVEFGYDIYAKGGWDKDWADLQLVGTATSANKVVTGTFAPTKANVGFGFQLAEKDDAKKADKGFLNSTLTAGIADGVLNGKVVKDSDSDNFYCTAAGTYTVKITFDDYGAVEKIEFTDYSAS